MPDCLVTLPKSFGLQQWIAEGDPAGAEWSGTLWEFRTYGARPNIEPGERVYICYSGRLIGYAPLVRLEYFQGHVCFIRGGGAVAVTISERIPGFRGWRYRWWDRADERPFPEWRGESRQGVLLEVEG